MSTISKTDKYEMFKKHESNRELNKMNLNKIIASIKVNNLLQFRPILVDKNMNIIDGQHRLEAAKALGLEVYYQIRKEATHEDIVLLNSNQRAWTYVDYFDYYISLGNEDYRKIKEYCQKTHMPLVDFVWFTKGSSIRKDTSIKDGSLKFPSKEKMQELEDLLWKTKKATDTIKNFCLTNNKFLNQARFKKALQTFVLNPEVDFQTFIEKITIKSSALKSCSDSASYYVMLRDIYNWKSHNPIA